MDYLKAKGELEVNEGYSARNGDGFTMSYTVPRAALESGVSKVTFQRKQIQPPKAKPSQPSNDAALEYAGRNLGKLTVAENLLQGPDAIHDAMIHGFCWRVFFGRSRAGTSTGHQSSKS